MLQQRPGAEETSCTICNTVRFSRTAEHTVAADLLNTFLLSAKEQTVCFSRYTIGYVVDPIRPSINLMQQYGLLTNALLNILQAHSDSAGASTLFTSPSCDLKIHRGGRKQRHAGGSMENLKPSSAKPLSWPRGLRPTSGTRIFCYFSVTDSIALTALPESNDSGTQTPQ